MAQFIELFVDQGTDFGLQITVTNDTDNTPRDISNSSFTCSFRKSFYSSSVSANLVMAVADGPNGILLANANSVVTANIKPGRYVFDIKEYDAVSNTRSRLLEGIATVNPQVTR